MLGTQGLNRAACDGRQARNALAQARLQLQYSSVRADRAGTLSNLQLTPGTYVPAGTPVAALVGVTTLLFPLLELAMILIVLVPLRLGRVSPRLAPFFRLVRSVQPWGMVEVFLLGMLVSLVKLSHLATVILGTAFWAMAALIVVLTFAARAFDTRLVWQTPVAEPAP